MDWPRPSSSVRPRKSARRKRWSWPWEEVRKTKLIQLFLTQHVYLYVVRMGIAVCLRGVGGVSRHHRAWHHIPRHRLDMLPCFLHSAAPAPSRYVSSGASLTRLIRSFRSQKIAVKSPSACSQRVCLLAAYSLGISCQLRLISRVSASRNDSCCPR